MDLKKIEDFAGLMSRFLSPTKTVKDHEIARLTAAGENYGSSIVSVKIDIASDDGPETIHAVAKMPPPAEILRSLFNTPITAYLETEFYKTIVPSLKNFQKEQGVEEFECFPQFYGARLSFDPEATRADKDSVLVIENLKFSGFEMVEKTLGFDLETTLLILEKLAKFHSTPIAMKLLKPEEFERSIKKFFFEFKMFQGESQEEFINAKVGEVVSVLEEQENAFFRDLIPKAQSLMKINASNVNHPKNSEEFVKEPFCTLTHCDLWVNNIMVKFQDEKPTKIKFVDFQMYENGAPGNDVIFFLLTSVQIPVLQQHFDHLINFYHQTFVDNLKRLKCETVDYSLSYFHSELETAIKTFEFFHCMLMLNPIYAPKDSIKELADFKEDDLTQKKEIHENHKERILFIVDLCHRKNWI